MLVTGHTGFKGSWLTLWLSELGAEVTGYALAPETDRWLFVAAGVERRCQHQVADIRDEAELDRAIAAARPELVFHLAAQPLVRKSYQEPIATIETNVMGTAHLLEAVRRQGKPCVVVVVTSDKCYENREWLYGYREDESMGGHDVYSMSKGATELVVSSYRRSFFGPRTGVRVASARKVSALRRG